MQNHAEQLQIDTLRVLSANVPLPESPVSIAKAKAAQFEDRARVIRACSDAEDAAYLLVQLLPEHVAAFALFIDLLEQHGTTTLPNRFLEVKSERFGPSSIEGPER